MDGFYALKTRRAASDDVVHVTEAAVTTARCSAKTHTYDMPFTLTFTFTFRFSSAAQELIPFLRTSLNQRRSRSIV